jgi:hypothetical protein
MGYILAGLIGAGLYHVAVIMLKVSNKEKEFVDWVNK